MASRELDREAPDGNNSNPLHVSDKNEECFMEDKNTNLNSELQNENVKELGYTPDLSASSNSEFICSRRRRNFDSKIPLANRKEVIKVIEMLEDMGCKQNFDLDPDNITQEEFMKTLKEVSLWVDNHGKELDERKKQSEVEEQAYLAEVERAEVDIQRALEMAHAQVENEYNEMKQRLSEEAAAKLSIMNERQQRARRIQNQLAAYSTLATDMAQRGNAYEICRYGSFLQETIESLYAESQKLLTEEMPELQVAQPAALAMDLSNILSQVRMPRQLNDE